MYVCMYVCMYICLHVPFGCYPRAMPILVSGQQHQVACVPCRESFGLPTIRRGALTHHGNVGGVSTASGTPSYALKESKWISGDVAVGELRDHRMTHSVRRCFRLPTLLFLKYMVCYMVYAC